MRCVRELTLFARRNLRGTDAITSVDDELIVLLDARRHRGVGGGAPAPGGDAQCTSSPGARPTGRCA